jgi:protein involved in polysaccharide export with SLBB domain
MSLFRSKTGFALLVASVVFATPMDAPAQEGPTDPALRAAMTHAQPGDRVAVQVYGEPTLTGVATLDERGRVMLPRIGLLQADAMTIAQLRDTIRARMAAFLREPAVDVAVLRRIIVIGEVSRPAVYYADLTTTVSEIVALAGGLKETANSGKVYRLRGADRLHLANWQSDQSPTADLRSGDQIWVGRKSWLELNILSFVSVATTIVALIISLSR